MCGRHFRDGQSEFSLSGQADSNEPSAIATDNKDIAVQFTDILGNVITPNTGTIPFQLENYAATVPFTVFPISATGNKPQQGCSMRKRISWSILTKVA